MNYNYILIIFTFILFVLILYKVFTNNIKNNREDFTNFNNKNEVKSNMNNNEFKLHVYDWGAQICIKDLESILNRGDMINNEFTWFRSPSKYSGFYHLDTGSHLLVDMLMMKRIDMIKNLKDNNVKYDDLNKTGYIYLQGGTPPVANFQNIDIEGQKYNNVPVCLMALDNQHMMEKEREAVNGIFGLSNIGKNNNLHKYSILNKLLENVNKKTVLLDFINSKMMIGVDNNINHHFKGKILKCDDNNFHRMDVEVIDSDNNKPYEILIDTGTLYSQFEYGGKVLLKGKNSSSGYIKIKDARLLPLELTGNIRQIILGYNDMYEGKMFIDFDNNLIYLEQNN